MNITKLIYGFNKKFFSGFSCWRWHPEVTLRYLPVVREIKKYPKDSKILEIGSGSLGITPYLKRPVTGLDLDFSGPVFPFLKPVLGDARKLTFKAESFDLVISIDLIEHLPIKSRGKVIEEMLQVAKKEVIIALPCGQKSFAQDKVLYQEYVKNFKKPFIYLKEHIENGLPETGEIVALIKQSLKKTKKKATIKIIPNENLQLRAFLMKGWMRKNFLLDIFFRKILLLFLPIFFLINKPPYYRQIFFVKIIQE